MADFVPFAEREEWKDTNPIPQDDGPNPVVPIAYSSQFRETHDYFRAVLRAKEISQRALQLTAEVISQNAANYTAWHYRRVCLFALNSDLNAEMDYLNKITLDNQKNYQVWYHRLAILERLNKADDSELQFIDIILADDSKNYHAWAHRQWVVRQFNLWDKEWSTIDKLLTRDLRNNSAWNHRFFVLKHTKGTIPDGQLGNPFPQFQLDDAVRLEELDQSFQLIRTAPNNESAWNYLYGVASYGNKPSVPAMEKLLKMAQELLQRAPINVHAHWIALECLQLQAEREMEKAFVSQAINHADQLCKLDGIREKYWSMRRMKLEEMQK